MSLIRTLLLALATLPIAANCQTLEESENEFLGERYVTYKNLKVGVILQKIVAVSGDSLLIRYEMGLSIFSRSRSSDDFMKKACVIVFDDGSHLLLNDAIYGNYFQEGKHQYSIKHELTPAELQLLQTKKINYFVIGDKKSSTNGRRMTC
jgi:hypothetical protein